MRKLLFLVTLFLSFGLISQNLKLGLPLGHISGATSSSFSPSEKFMVSSSEDNTAMIWEASSGKLLHTLKGHSGYVYTAEFNSSGTQIVTSSYDKTARIWDALTGGFDTHIRRAYKLCLYRSF